MTASIRRCSALGLGLFVFFTGSLALAQAGGAAGEESGGAAGADPRGEGGMGEGGASAVRPGTRLGRDCIDDLDCQDTNTPDLQCITAKQTVLGNGAPPHGLCSSACQSDDDCSALSVGSICYPFNESASAGYCVEGCAFGEPDVGKVKCHGRADFACNPALLGDTGEPCASTTSCLSGELCIDGTCAVVFPACLPSCRGDLDCVEGQYCDQSFLSGVCVPQKPVGKGLGEACTVGSEPDDCLGFCQADTASSAQGHCSTTCGIGNECAWNATTERFDGACFYASVLTAETGFIGDFGFCTPTCSCSDECGDPTLECQLLSGSRLNAGFRGPGLCFSADPGAAPIEECATSEGGAGGEPSGTGGTMVRGGTNNGGASRGGTNNGGASRGGTNNSDPSEGGESSSTSSGSGDSSGCGCRLTAQSAGTSSAGLLLALIGLLVRRRRQVTARARAARVATRPCDR